MASLPLSSEGKQQLIGTSQEGAGGYRGRFMVVIPVKSLFQDILDGAIAWVAEGVGPGAGGI
jgi:hypothetical protein